MLPWSLKTMTVMGLTQAFGNVPAPQAFLGQTFFYQPAGPGTAPVFCK